MLEKMEHQSASAPGTSQNKDLGLTGAPVTGALVHGVLITGGYHTPNLKKLLKEQNISYIVLTPTITHETNTKRYEQILLNRAQGLLTNPHTSTPGIIPFKASTAAPMNMVQAYQADERRDLTSFAMHLGVAEPNLKEDSQLQDQVKSGARMAGIGESIQKILGSDEFKELERAKREVIIGGNWKMALKTEKEATELLTSLARELTGVDPKALDLVITVAPSFVHLSAVNRVLKQLETSGKLSSGLIRLAAQDVSAKDPGAWTGQTSVEQLKDLGVEYVIIGHSEARRGDEKAPQEQRLTQSNEVVNLKIKNALRNNLKIILAVGENLSEFDGQQTYLVLEDQIRKSLADIPSEQMKNVVIAYEPVWAIGTGRTATPEQANEVQRFIRALLFEMFGKETASQTPIQYGGSVNAKNIESLIKQLNIDGGLIGGASLKSEDFVAIVQKVAKARGARLGEGARGVTIKILNLSNQVLWLSPEEGLKLVLMLLTKGPYSRFSEIQISDLVLRLSKDRKNVEIKTLKRPTATAGFFMQESREVWNHFKPTDEDVFQINPDGTVVFLKSGKKTIPADAKQGSIEYTETANDTITVDVLKAGARLGEISDARIYLAQDPSESRAFDITNADGVLDNTVRQRSKSALSKLWQSPLKWQTWYYPSFLKEKSDKIIPPKNRKAVKETNVAFNHAPSNLSKNPPNSPATKNAWKSVTSIFEVVSNLLSVQNIFVIINSIPRPLPVINLSIYYNEYKSNLQYNHKKNSGARMADLKVTNLSGKTLWLSAEGGLKLISQGLTSLPLGKEPGIQIQTPMELKNGNYSISDMAYTFFRLSDDGEVEKLDIKYDPIFSETIYWSKTPLSKEDVVVINPQGDVMLLKEGKNKSLNVPQGEIKTDKTLVVDTLEAGSRLAEESDQNDEYGLTAISKTSLRQSIEKIESAAGARMAEKNYSIQKPLDSSTTRFPFSLFDGSFSSAEPRMGLTLSGLGGWMRMSKMPFVFSGGYRDELEKSLSPVNSIRLLLTVARYTDPFLSPFGVNAILWPLDWRNLAMSMWRFSSTRMRSLLSGKRDKLLFFNAYSGVVNRRPDGSLGQRGEASQNIGNTHPALQKLQNHRNHHPRPSKDGFSVANIAINADVVSNNGILHGLNLQGENSTAFSSSQLGVGFNDRHYFSNEGARLGEGARGVAIKILNLSNQVLWLSPEEGLKLVLMLLTKGPYSHFSEIQISDLVLRLSKDRKNVEIKTLKRPTATAGFFMQESREVWNHFKPTDEDVFQINPDGTVVFLKSGKKTIPADAKQGSVEYAEAANDTITVDVLKAGARLMTDLHVINLSKETLWLPVAEGMKLISMALAKSKFFSQMKVLSPRLNKEWEYDLGEMPFLVLRFSEDRENIEIEPVGKRRPISAWFEDRAQQPWPVFKPTDEDVFRIEPNGDVLFLKGGKKKISPDMKQGFVQLSKWSDELIEANVLAEGARLGTLRVDNLSRKSLLLAIDSKDTKLHSDNQNLSGARMAIDIIVDDVKIQNAFNAFARAALNYQSSDRVLRGFIDKTNYTEQEYLLSKSDRDLKRQALNHSRQNLARQIVEVVEPILMPTTSDDITSELIKPLFSLFFDRNQIVIPNRFDEEKNVAHAVYIVKIKNQKKKSNSKNKGARLAVDEPSQGVLKRLEEIYKKQGAERDDYNISPIVAKDAHGFAIGTVEHGEAVIWFNHRGDRSMSALEAFTNPQFNAQENRFDQEVAVVYIPFANYDPKTFEKRNLKEAFSFSLPSHTTLSDVLKSAGVVQGRFAESDKGTHVTYFFDGRKKLDYAKEGIYVGIVPSEAVPDKDKKPEMKFKEVADQAIAFMDKPDLQKQKFIFINLATDIQGHVVGLDKERAKKAVLATDEAVGKIRQKVKELGGVLLVTGDHGNIEEMAVLDKRGIPLNDNDGIIASAQHSIANPVPFIVEGLEGVELREGKTLANIAPTVLDILGVPAAEGMEESLLKKFDRKKIKGPVVLVIRDGWGINRFNTLQADEWNAIKLANPPVDRDLMINAPHTLLKAHGDAVGLPDYQMGDSDNGHTTMGAGRIVPTVYKEILDQIKDGRFKENSILTQTFKRAMQGKKDIHILGLLSDGGVHSDYQYVLGLLEMAKELEVEKSGVQIFLHAILDGRDRQTRIPDQNGLYYLQKVLEKASELGLSNFHIADVVGRHFAMDRDAFNRDKEAKTKEDFSKSTSIWQERFRVAYDAWVYGKETGVWLMDIQNKDWNVRHAAIKALGKMGRQTDQETIEALITILEDEDWRARNAAAQALGQIGRTDKQIIEALDNALSDKDWFVRSSAAKALGQIGEKAKNTLPALIKALDDVFMDVRRSAAEAIGKMGASAKGAIPNLKQLALRKEDFYWPHDSLAAKEAIKRILGARMAESEKSDWLKDVPSLAGGLKDKNPQVRSTAAALLGVKARFEPGLYDPKVRNAVIDALIEVSDDENPKVRASVASAFGFISPDATQAMPILVKMLKDKDSRVRFGAAYGLSSLDTVVEEAIPILEDMLKNSNLGKSDQALFKGFLTKIREKQANPKGPDSSPAKTFRDKLKRIKLKPMTEDSYQFSGKASRLDPENQKSNGARLIKIDQFFKEINPRFILSPSSMKDLAGHFADEMTKGLSNQPSTLKMINSFVPRLTGQETGKYLVIDLGGSNFRILTVELENGVVRDTKMQKFVLTQELIRGDQEIFFDFIAQSIKDFISSEGLPANQNYPLGFTFSFPVKQTSVDKGTLIHWSKGFEVKGVEGSEVVGLLQAALKRKGLKNIQPTALINDAVGTLATVSDATIGAIIGTGTNGAYWGQDFAINTEWAGFNHFPKDFIVEYDHLLDVQSGPDVGRQILEKMVSGKYLGEIARLILQDMASKRLIFQNKSYSILEDPYALKSENLFEILNDATSGPEKTSALFSDASAQDRQLVKNVADLVVTRSARIFAAISYAIVWVKDPDLTSKHIVAVDGSVYTKNPVYQSKVKEAAKDLLGEKADRLEFTITQDGSGVGAAVIAAIITSFNHSDAKLDSADTKLHSDNQNPAGARMAISIYRFASLLHHAENALLQHGDNKDEIRKNFATFVRDFKLEKEPVAFYPNRDPLFSARSEIEESLFNHSLSRLFQDPFLGELIKGDNILYERTTFKENPPSQEESLEKIFGGWPPMELESVTDEHLYHFMKYNLGIPENRIRHRLFVKDVSMMIAGELTLSDKVKNLLRVVSSIRDLGRRMEDKSSDKYGAVETKLKALGESLPLKADILRRKVNDYNNEYGTSLTTLEYARKIIEEKNRHWMSRDGQSIVWTEEDDQILPDVAAHEQQTLDILKNHGYGYNEDIKRIILSHHYFSLLGDALPETEGVALEDLQTILAIIRLSLVMDTNRREYGRSLRESERFFVDVVAKNEKIPDAIRDKVLEAWKRLLAGPQSTQFTNKLTYPEGFDPEKIKQQNQDDYDFIESLKNSGARLATVSAIESARLVGSENTSISNPDFFLALYLAHPIQTFVAAALAEAPRLAVLGDVYAMALEGEVGGQRLKVYRELAGESGETTYREAWTIGDLDSKQNEFNLSDSRVRGEILAEKSRRFQMAREIKPLAEIAREASTALGFVGVSLDELSGQFANTPEGDQAFEKLVGVLAKWMALDSSGNYYLEGIDSLKNKRLAVAQTAFGSLFENRQRKGRVTQERPKDVVLSMLKSIDRTGQITLPAADDRTVFEHFYGFEDGRFANIFVALVSAQKKADFYQRQCEVLGTLRPQGAQKDQLLEAIQKDPYILKLAQRYTDYGRTSRLKDLAQAVHEIAVSEDTRPDRIRSVAINPMRLFEKQLAVFELMEEILQFA
jgi:hexokinase